MVKIWGRKDSSNVQKVLWCCDELGVAFERIDIGGSFGGNKEKPYLDLNPNGLVPTIEDGGFVLWESNSIVRYLADRYGEGRWISSTPEGRADSNRWMDWQLTTMGSAMVPIFIGLVRTPEEKRDQTAIENARQKAAKAWKIVEDHLAKNSYLSGDTFTMGDIPLGVWAYRWFNLPIRRPELMHLKTWYDRLCKRLLENLHLPRGSQCHYVVTWQKFCFPSRHNDPTATPNGYNKTIRRNSEFLQLSIDSGIALF